MPRVRDIARIGDAAVIPDVHEIAATDSSFRVRIVAMETLGAFGDPRAVQMIGSAVHEENVPNRRWFRKWRRSSSWN